MAARSSATEGSAEVPERRRLPMHGARADGARVVGAQVSAKTVRRWAAEQRAGGVKIGDVERKRAKFSACGAPAEPAVAAAAKKR